MREDAGLGDEIGLCKSMLDYDRNTISVTIIE